MDSYKIRDAASILLNIFIHQGKSSSNKMKTKKKEKHNKLNYIEIEIE